MQLFADLNQPANVDANKVEWVASPLAGVERRMLERDGDEVARATSIVRYAPDSFFSPHSHTGGEEYYVLSGVFSDESGDYPAGHYVRNPIGSSHKPFTKSGCEIYVKLRQMQPADQSYVVVDTLTSNTIEVNQVVTLPLHRFEAEEVMIRQLMVGDEYREESMSGLEILILSGKAIIEAEQRNQGHWFRWPAQQSITITAKENLRLLVKKNHLTN